MQKIIAGEQPFQVLSTNFTIGPSESGYDLYFSADGREYSKLFTVAANTNRQVTQVAAGSYYYLEGNTDTAVTVNWIANCYSGGEGGGGTQYTAGNGVQISGSEISVKAGEGLAFSGDTLVVSGGTGGGQAYYIDNVYGNYSGLSELLFSYWDSGSTTMSSAYPADDIHIYVWMSQDFQGAISTDFKGYIEVFPDHVYEEDGVNIMMLTSVFSVNERGYALKIGLCDDGSTRGNSLYSLSSDISIENYAQNMKFGNDTTGELYYDADNDRFEFGGNPVATGDTSSVVGDVIDYYILKECMIEGNYLNNRYYVPFMRLFVISSGSTNIYPYPAISWRELPSHYMVDGHEIAYEFTFKYADWILKIDTPDSNYGTNLRITQA